MSKLKIAFFGTPDIAAIVLDELKAVGIVPSLIITNPDRPVGRKQTLTSPPVKVWSKANNIEVLQPQSLKQNSEIVQSIGLCDLSVVVAYGKILPKKMLDIPKYGTLNVHPSLLPKFRGASPIRSAILADERETGVTIMLMDEEMDHGPIVAQQPIEIAKENWPIKGRELDEGLARLGGALLATTIPDWVAGTIEAKEQDHTKATYCKKITKADGEIDLSADAYQNYLKFCAYDGWPGTFFFAKKEGAGRIRVKITDAEYKDGAFVISRVIPEGKNAVPYETFLNMK